jgi:hypothetical protein
MYEARKAVMKSNSSIVEMNLKIYFKKVDGFNNGDPGFPEAAVGSAWNKICDKLSLPLIIANEKIWSTFGVILGEVLGVRRDWSIWSRNRSCNNEWLEKDCWNVFWGCRRQDRCFIYVE